MSAAALEEARCVVVVWSEHSIGLGVCAGGSRRGRARARGAGAGPAGQAVRATVRLSRDPCGRPVAWVPVPPRSRSTRSCATSPTWAARHYATRQSAASRKASRAGVPAPPTAPEPAALGQAIVEEPTEPLPLQPDTGERDDEHPVADDPPEPVHPTAEGAPRSAPVETQPPRSPPVLDRPTGAANEPTRPVALAPPPRQGRAGVFTMAAVLAVGLMGVVGYVFTRPPPGELPR